MEKYDPKKIEPRWQDFWAKNPELYAAKEDSDKEKQYILDMFPYPSGEGLHVGHVESYTATDIISRFLKMKSKNVLRPQGWDAFGLPAENFAIKTKIHPSETTKKSIQTFKSQMNKMGFVYDWSREVNSSDSQYYKWTQWFFLLLYKNGWAYKKLAKANWCPSCQTVLANEQVVSGKCERCSTAVIQKDLAQWFFKITDFIEDNKKTSGLTNGLDKIDWPNSTKAAQKNWIGKSIGVQFKMPINGSDLFIEVYTTRLDTAYGITYAVAAPEHSIITQLGSRITNRKEVEKYLANAKKKTDLERMEAKVKTGVELQGVKAINPFNGEEVPLFVADYVLSHYGTGAVMAVPAHDERDFEFANKYKLKIKEVIKSVDNNSSVENEAYVEDGILINSQEYIGLTSQAAREKMADHLEKNKLGEKKVNYKIRDWLVSRQRYWGAPIPIIYCEHCGTVPVPEKDLPVLLPTDVDFKPTGESPLVNSKKFHDIKCPQCDGKAKRESDTMDTFVCSSWYYFRYADPKNAKEFASKKKIKKWLPVDLYVGGAEHSVLHLLYARFFTKVLHNLGYIDFDEPFLKLRHQGIILAEDGRKMSKSLGNVINPDDIVNQYGADSLRLFEMFMGPLEDMKPWNVRGIVGMQRFLDKVYRLRSKLKTQNSKPQLENQNLMHKTVKKVTEDIENLRFNTAISALMILTNELDKKENIQIADYELLIILLSPLAPHITEELWEKLGRKESIFLESWPKYNPKLTKDEEIDLVIQVNGKLRDSMKVPADINEEDAKKFAIGREKIKNLIKDKAIKKTVFVKGRLINIVIL